MTSDLVSRIKHSDLLAQTRCDILGNPQAPSTLNPANAFWTTQLLAQCVVSPLKKNPYKCESCWEPVRSPQSCRKASFSRLVHTLFGTHIHLPVSGIHVNLQIQSSRATLKQSVSPSLSPPVLWILNKNILC